MSVDVDLFGNEVETRDAGTDTAERVPINDMELMQTVLQTAIRSGFVLTSGGAVRRCEDDAHAAAVPNDVDRAVHQLIDTRWLEVGGVKGVQDGRHRTTARSVLVPRSSRQRLAKWQALDTPSRQKKGA